MNRWESAVERIIREAMEEGEFDDLEGKGLPLDLSENPFEDPEMRMAHRLLRNNRVVPPWIEERKEVLAEIELMRSNLARDWERFEVAKGAEGRLGPQVAVEEWQRALADFRRQVTTLNRRIALYNLKAPSAAFHHPQLDAERELERIEREKIVRGNKR